MSSKSEFQGTTKADTKCITTPKVRLIDLLKFNFVCIIYIIMIKMYGLILNRVLIKKDHWT